MYVVQSVPSVGERWVLRGIVSKSLEFRSTGGCNLYQYAVLTDISKFLPWLRCVIPVGTYFSLLLMLDFNTLFILFTLFSDMFLMFQKMILVW
jgi:hypothetical protein